MMDLLWLIQFPLYFYVISRLVNAQQCPRSTSVLTKKDYAMYVWTEGFDEGILGCNVTKFLEWDENGECFIHVWDTEPKRERLWATCNRVGREVDTIFVSGVHTILKSASETGDCTAAGVAMIKTMLTEGHTKVSNLKIYGLFADSDINVSEKGRVEYIVHYNDICAGNQNEKFDGVAVNNEAYANIKCDSTEDRVTYLNNLQEIVTNARKQVGGVLLTHYSVGWHWGRCNSGTSLISWNGNEADFNHHAIDIFDSVDVQVGYTTFPAISERMIIAGYDHAMSLNKPFFTTLYTNYASPCQSTFFPNDTCQIGGHSESDMFSIIDGFSVNDIPDARPCIHYFRGVYSAGAHPDWPVHD